MPHPHQAHAAEAPQVPQVPRLPLTAPSCLTRAPQLLPRELMERGYVPDISCHLNLGSGAFGSVLRIRHATTGQAYALKIVEKQPLKVRRNMMPQLRREIGIQSALRHPNILRVVSVVEDHLMSICFWISVLEASCGFYAMPSL